MTTTASIACGAPTTTVTVVCIGAAPKFADGLRSALAALPFPGGVEWRVRRPPGGDDDSPSDIALCDAASVAGAVRRWPGCAVIAIVPSGDDGAAVIAALQDGAATCIRGDDVALTAAFVAAMARRRGMVPEDLDR